MSNKNSTLTKSASNRIFSEFEQNLEAGGVRDMWLSIRQELTDGGPSAVHTYLESEYQRRTAKVKNALSDLKDQLKESN